MANIVDDLDLGSLDDLQLLADVDFDLDDFDIDLDSTDRISTGFLKPKVMRPKTVDYANAQHMAKNIEVSAGMNYYAIVAGSFIFGDLLEALIMDHRLKIRELHISTLSLSDDNVDSLVNIMRYSPCESLHLVVSGYFYSHEKHNLVPYIHQELASTGKQFVFSVAGSHMKIALIRTDELLISIHGSANLRSSANIEQFSIAEDADLYNFNRKYFDAIESSYSISKPIGERNDPLWQVVAAALENPEKQDQAQARPKQGEKPTKTR